MTRFGQVTLIPVNGTGPEDVVVDPDGRVYTGLDDGRIIRITHDGARIELIADTGGRPLGIELYGDGELLVCDHVRGLLVVTIADGAIHNLATEAAGKPLLACNNAAIGADGTIYFSDSSARFPIPRWREDLIERTASGRLLRRDPDGVIEQLADGLEFANGVALAPDESFVAVAESGGFRVRTVALTGANAGSIGELAAGLPGFPDNIATGSDGLIWVTQASPKVSALELAQRLPGPARAAVRRMPVKLQPQPRDTVGVIAFDADGHRVHELSGEINGFRMLTGVREHHGSLHFGSLMGSVIAKTTVPA